MSDDLLERATKALREEGGGPRAQDPSALVRARVLAQTKRRAQLRPQGMWQWAAVVCLGFFVSTAMAHVIRVQLPRVIEALRAEPAAPPPAAPKRPRPASQPKVVVPEVSAVPEPEPVAPSVEVEQAVVAAAPSVPAQPVRVHARPLKARSVLPAPVQQHVVVREPEPPPVAAPEVEPATPTAPPPTATPVKVKVESAELALFRRAQALHLTHDPRAIQAWDAFLRVAGTSALAPEARYNRALGLVRAGRVAEAKSALAPFAEGKYGAYRRDEAQALLVRLVR